MKKLNKPNLIFRISHLIIIQMIFIFGALALVLFYPEDAVEDNSYYDNLNSRVDIISTRIWMMLESESDHYPADIDSIQTNLHIDDNEQTIESIELVDFDAVSGEYDVRLIFGIKSDKFWSEAELIDLFGGILNSDLLEFRNSPIISDDGQHLYYIVKSENSSIRRGLFYRVNFSDRSIASSKLAYLLFIFFLISTLISLLIIYMIKKDVEEPIQNLIRGSSGNTEEPKDILLKNLHQSFNKLSTSLSEKKNELEGSNRELLNINRTLAESESILTALVNYSPDAIIVTDLKNRVLLSNFQAARDFGYALDEMKGEPITSLLQMSEYDSQNRTIDFNAPAVAEEIICNRHDKTSFPSLLLRIPIGLEGCQPMAVLYFIKNISESASYQEMILKLDRIATKGKMARGIAHEINNYLAILQGNLELVPMFLAQGKMDKLEDRLGLMRETVHKITAFTEGLSRFSEEDADFVKEDLNQLIENLVAFLRPQNKYDKVKISKTLSDEIKLVEIDASQIQLLLVNLINNATDALETTSDKNEIVISTGMCEKKGYVCIKVVDQGGGVDEEFVNDLFAKRFSTKRDGNGLGLLTCSRIIKNHGGTIKYDRIDGSSCFMISLPTRLVRSESSENQPTTASF